MSSMLTISKTMFKIKKLPLFVLGSLLFGVFSSFAPVNLNPTTGHASAACITTAPATTFGTATQTVNVAAAGTYRVWSRIKVPDTTSNSYYFQVDAGCNYNVGNSASISPNTWTWVNYQDAAAAATIDVTLTAGAHTLTYTGNAPDVQLDRVLLLGDLACVPIDTGDNCAVTDMTPPTVAVSAPASGATVSGTVNIAATATDASGIAKVEFYVDGTLKSTSTTPAYSYAWNSSTVPNGPHSLTAKAFDTAPNC